MWSSIGVHQIRGGSLLPNPPALVVKPLPANLRIETGIPREFSYPLASSSPWTRCPSGGVLRISAMNAVSQRQPPRSVQNSADVEKYAREPQDAAQAKRGLPVLGARWENEIVAEMLAGAGAITASKSVIKQQPGCELAQPFNVAITSRAGWHRYE